MKNLPKMIALTLGITTMFASALIASPGIREIKSGLHSGAQPVMSEAILEMTVEDAEDRLSDLQNRSNALKTEIETLTAKTDHQERLEQYLAFSAEIDILKDELKSFNVFLKQEVQNGHLAETAYDVYENRIEALLDLLEQAEEMLAEKFDFEDDILEASSESSMGKDPTIANIFGQTIAYGNRVQVLVREKEKLEAMAAEKNRNRQFEALISKIAQCDDGLEALQAKLLAALNNGTLSQADFDSKTAALEMLRETLAELEDSIEISATLTESKPGKIHKTH